MNKPKIAAIVPAHNEEMNIGNVLRVLLQSDYFDEVIVVDGGSTDNTAKISQELGAKVIQLAKKGGKGNDTREAVKRTDAEIIAFFDADITGLSKNHISLMVEPVLSGEAVMSVGLSDRYGGLPEFFVKIDPLLGIAGEKVMRRFVFENLPENLSRGFDIDITLNYYCLVNNLPVKYVGLEGLDMIVKEVKWGIFKGFSARLLEIIELIKVRFLLMVKRRDFN